MASDVAIGAPEEQHRASYSSDAEVSLIHGEVEGDGGAVVLAHGVDLLRRRAPDVFGERLGCEDVETDALLIELVADRPSPAIATLISAREVLRRCLRKPLMSSGPWGKRGGVIGSADPRSATAILHREQR